MKRFQEKTLLATRLLILCAAAFAELSLASILLKPRVVLSEIKVDNTTNDNGQLQGLLASSQVHFKQQPLLEIGLPHQALALDYSTEYEPQTIKIGSPNEAAKRLIGVSNDLLDIIQYQLAEAQRFANQPASEEKRHKRRWKRILKETRPFPSMADDGNKITHRPGLQLAEKNIGPTYELDQLDGVIQPSLGLSTAKDTNVNEEPAFELDSERTGIGKLWNWLKKKKPAKTGYKNFV